MKKQSIVLTAVILLLLSAAHANAETIAGAEAPLPVSAKESPNCVSTTVDSNDLDAAIVCRARDRRNITVSTSFIGAQKLLKVRRLNSPRIDEKVRCLERSEGRAVFTTEQGTVLNYNDVEANAVIDGETIAMDCQSGG